MLNELNISQNAVPSAEKDHSNIPIFSTPSNSTSEKQSTSMPTNKRAENKSYSQVAQAPVKPRIPPIFLSYVKDMKHLMQNLGEIDCQIPTIQTLSNEDIKLNCSDESSFRMVMDKLREGREAINHSLYGIQFHTFQVKNKASFIVVIRHLHPTTKPEKITEALREKGHQAVYVTNLVSNKIQTQTKKDGSVFRKTVKTPRPLFFVEVEPNSNNKGIYEIDYLMGVKIRIEAPRQKANEVVQCRNCQLYGHTKAYCTRQARCIKCDRQHHTIQCQKPRNQECKCANCGGIHTANWKGCPVYQEKLTAEAKIKKVTVVERMQQKAEIAITASAPTPTISKPSSKSTQSKQPVKPSQSTSKK